MPWRVASPLLSTPSIPIYKCVLYGNSFELLEKPNSLWYHLLLFRYF